jgi:Holliday junction DNA helicase RuvB
VVSVEERTVSSDINDARPSSIAHVVGQRGVVEQVTVALDAAHQDGRRFDHALLVGGPGLGKTQIASLVGREMGTEYHELLGQSVTGVGDLNAVLLAAGERAVVFIDEAHELDRAVQTALYLALDKRKVIVQGTRRGATPVGVPVADFTLLLATTDEYRLLQPLRDRMRLVLRFQSYSADELVQLLRHRLRALGWPVDEAVLPEIAARSRGVPRLALRLAQAAWRVARSGGGSAVTPADLGRACLLDGIDGLGLGPVEQQYLHALLDGPARLNVLASRLGLPARTVAEVCEPFLIRAGLVEKDDQGRRQITAGGRDHVGRRVAV